MAVDDRERVPVERAQRGARDPVPLRVVLPAVAGAAEARRGDPDLRDVVVVGLAAQLGNAVRRDGPERQGKGRFL